MPELGPDTGFTLFTVILMITVHSLVDPSHNSIHRTSLFIALIQSTRQGPLGLTVEACIRLCTDLFLFYIFKDFFF